MLGAARYPFQFLEHLCFFQESIVDEQESNKDENIHLRRFLRVLANLLIICCLCGSGYLIYFVVKRSQTFSKMQNAGWYERNEVRKLCFQFPAGIISLGISKWNATGWGQHPRQRDSLPGPRSPLQYLCTSCSCNAHWSHWNFLGQINSSCREGKILL